MGMTQVKEKRAAFIARMANHPDTDLLVLAAFTSADTGKAYVAGDVISRSVISEDYYDLLVAAGTIVSVKDYLLEGDVDYTSVTTAEVAVGTVPNGATLINTIVDLSAAFNGDAHSTMGTDADQDVYMELAEIDLTSLDAQTKVQSDTVGEDTPVKMFMDAIGPTTGAGVAKIEYRYTSSGTIDHSDGSTEVEPVVALTGDHNTITNIRMVVSEAFEEGARLTVGVTGEEDKFVESSEIDLTAVATTDVVQDETYAVPVTVNAYYSTVPLVGSATVELTYETVLATVPVEDDDTTVTLGVIPTDGEVINLAYEVTEAFDGGTSISVGVDANHDMYFPAADYDPYTVASETNTIGTAVSENTTVKIYGSFVDDDTPTTGATTVTLVYEKEVDSLFDHTLNGIPVTVAAVSSGCVVSSVVVNISEAFDGTAAMTIGVASDHDKVVELSDVDLTQTGTTTLSDDVSFAGSDTILIYYDATGPTTGHATVTLVIEYPLAASLTTASSFPVTLGTVPKYSVIKSVTMDTAAAWDLKPYVTIGVDGDESSLDDGTGFDLTAVAPAGNLTLSTDYPSGATVKAYLHNTSAASTGAVSLALTYEMNTSDLPDPLTITPADFDGAGVAVCTVPAGSTVTGLTVEIDPAFNGIPQFELGVASDHDKVATAAQVDLTTAAMITLTPSVAFVAGDDLKVYLTSLSSATGTVVTTATIEKVVTSSSFGHGDITTDSILLGSIPANRTVTAVSLEVTTAFTGENISITVGDASDQDRLMAADENDPTAEDTYETAPEHLYAAETPIRLYIQGTLASAGEATVSVTYE